MLGFMHRLFLCTFLLIATLVAAQDASKTAPGFDEAKALAFLERYKGHWVGTYTLRDTSGMTLQELQADVTYEWENTKNGRVLKGRAVYGAEGGMAIAESETFIENRQIFSYIEEGGKTRTYRGRIDQNGKTIAWVPIDLDNPLNESFRETFGRDAEGRETLTSQAYENIVRNDVSVLLTMQGLLYREAPQAKPLSPATQ